MAIRPRTRARIRALANQRASQFANAVLQYGPHEPASRRMMRQFREQGYPELRRYQYARRVERLMRERGYPVYAIRTALRAIHDGRDPHYSLDSYYMEGRYD